MDKTINSVLERMDQVLKPHREWQKQIDKILEPQRQFQARMDKLLEPQRRLQEQMTKYLEPQRKLQEQMQKYLEPQRQLQGHMKKYLEPQKRLQEQLEKFLEPQRQLQVQMEKYLEPQRKLQAQMQKYLEPQRKLQEQLSKYIRPLNDYLSDPVMESILINSEGSISVSDKVLDVESVTKSIESFTGDYSSTEEFLHSFFQWLERLGDATRAAVIYLVLPYLLAIIANLTTPIYKERWKEYADIDHRTAKKEIIREANEFYSPEDLKGYRFVYTTTLHVRKLGNMSSEIIDDLYLGKTVSVLNKEKRWAFIEYHDDDTGSLKQGWVFSRYLHKFNK